jgi:hypothetical protein
VAEMFATVIAHNREVMERVGVETLIRWEEAYS